MASNLAPPAPEPRPRRKRKYENLRSLSQEWLDRNRQTGDFDKDDIWENIGSEYKRKHPAEYQLLVNETIGRACANQIAIYLRGEKDDDGDHRVYGCYEVVVDGKTKECYKRWDLMPPDILREAWERYVTKIGKDIQAALRQYAYVDSVDRQNGGYGLDDDWKDEIKEQLS